MTCTVLNVTLGYPIGTTMKLITWNVQWCRGVDGIVDPPRIVAEAKAMADFDVLCLQEVAHNFPHPRLAGSAGEDQFSELAALLPTYTPIAGVTVDVLAHPNVDRLDPSSSRRRFGNMILSRFPVTQVFRYSLPFPVEPGVKGMPRGALEAIVETPAGGLRVITTHLEYYGQMKRAAQLEALRSIYAEGSRHARFGTITEERGGPFHTFMRPEATVITGDFNFEPDDPLYQRLIAAFDDSTPPLIDAWQAAHAGKPHPGTFKVHQRAIPDEPELHCDFVFLSPQLLPRVEMVEVNRQTQASDHQPVLLALG